MVLNGKNLLPGIRSRSKNNDKFYGREEIIKKITVFYREVYSEVVALEGVVKGKIKKEIKEVPITVEEEMRKFRQDEVQKIFEMQKEGKVMG